MKTFIKLPVFIGEEPLEKFEYKSNNIKSNLNEKLYELSYNINNNNNNNNKDKNPLNDTGKKIKNLKLYYTYKDENDQTLLFESRFESENLLCVFKIEEKNYQLVLQNDTNTTGYLQWFFFLVQNKKKQK